MALVDLIDVSKAYESKQILCEINLSINAKERIAIIGQNGGGKSTLMKIVAGVLEMDEGRRIVEGGTQIKMLAQVPHFESGISVKEAIERELKELYEAKARYDHLSEALAENFDDRALIEEHAKLGAFLDHHHAWSLEGRVERVLREFDLKEYEDRLVESLSGGEQRRVALAGLLLNKPDILLLDEPTNHLDVYMVEFLEQMLMGEDFTLLFISHDRYFIDHIATRSIEIEDCKVRSFQGGYGDYLRQKEALVQSLQTSHEKLLKLLKSEEEWLHRGVRARLKRNEGRKERVMQLREEAKKNPSVIRKMKLELEREQKNFNQERSVNRQKMLFEVEQLSLSLGGKKLIENFSTRILRNERIAIVGKNGAGKSTLLRLLLGKMSPDSGKIKRGAFEIGYFDQHREMLNDEDNLLETFCPMGGDRVEVKGRSMHVYGYLKNFLFPKEDLNKKIGLLSGGEKNRVALALLFTKDYDCLILDEPTNDLDIQTINILEEYLMSFDGAVIIVSHDRYFVDKIATKLFIFEGEGRIVESYQNYSEYLDIEKELKELDSINREAVETKPTQQKERQRSQKLSYKEKLALEALPQEIEKLEEEIEAINRCIADPECYKEKGLGALAQELDQKSAQLEEKVEFYLLLEEKREELEGE